MPNSVGICLREVVDERDERVDHDDELRARLDRDVDVGGRDHAAVDQLAVLDDRGLVDHRQRGRGAHGGGDRDVVPALGAEHDPLARVEVGGGEVELVLQQAEVVGAVGVGEHGADVLLDPRAGVEAGRQRVGERDREVDGRERAEAAAERARHAEQVQRQLERLGGVLAVVRPQQHVEVEVAERRRHLVVDDPHHLLGRDPVGRQRGDQRAGAGADVDVELVDAAVDRQQVERAQRADLIDAAGEAAAAQHQRGAGLRAARTALPGPLLELDDLAHPRRSLLRGVSGLWRGTCGPVRTMTVLRLTLSRTSTRPRWTVTSVPSQRSWTLQRVPRTVAAALRPLVRNEPLALPNRRRTRFFELLALGGDRAPSPCRPS